MAFTKTEKFEKFAKKVYLSSPTMHGEELKYMTEAFDTNWMSTVGENIDEIERIAAEKIGCRYAVALLSTDARGLWRMSGMSIQINH